MSARGGGISHPPVSITDIESGVVGIDIEYKSRPKKLSEDVS